MKFCKVLAASALVLASSQATQAYAESDLLSVGASVDVASDYMFRGFNLYDGISVQPAVDLGFDFGDLGSLNLSTWGHLSAEGGQSASEKFTEVDYTLSYSYSMDMVALSVGHAFYTYPRSSDDIEDTAEVFGSVGLDVPLAPTLTVFHDYEEFDTEYYELSFSHEVTTDALGEGFNATPYVAFGFATNSEKVYADDGLVQVTTGLSFATTVGDFDVVPSLNYTFESDDALDNEFWAGISFAYAI